MYHRSDPEYPHRPATAGETSCHNTLAPTNCHSLGLYRHTQDVATGHCVWPSPCSTEPTHPNHLASEREPDTSPDRPAPNQAPTQSRPASYDLFDTEFRPPGRHSSHSATMTDSAHYPARPPRKTSSQPVHTPAQPPQAHKTDDPQTSHHNPQTAP